jgi:hypothetical protein
MRHEACGATLLARSPVEKSGGRERKSSHERQQPAIATNDIPPSGPTDENFSLQ